MVSKPMTAPAVKTAKPTAKPVSKAAAKAVVTLAKPRTVVKPSVKAVVQKALPARPAAAKPVRTKVKKPKLVRDSFTIPKDEYGVIDSLKIRAGKLGQAVKKSELLRAGIKTLAKLSDIQFKAALSDVPALKTGRPKHVKSVQG